MKRRKGDHADVSGAVSVVQDAEVRILIVPPQLELDKASVVLNAECKTRYDWNCSRWNPGGVRDSAMMTPSGSRRGGK